MITKQELIPVMDLNTDNKYEFDFLFKSMNCVYKILQAVTEDRQGRSAMEMMAINDLD